MYELTVGIDLAKEVFAVCVLDVRGTVIERRTLRRDGFERWAVLARIEY
jgi:transposase